MNAIMLVTIVAHLNSFAFDVRFGSTGIKQYPSVAECEADRAHEVQHVKDHGIGMSLTPAKTTYINAACYPTNPV